MFRKQKYFTYYITSSNLTFLHEGYVFSLLRPVQMSFERYFRVHQAQNRNRTVPAGIETFVSVHPDWSAGGMSASMLLQTSSFHSCHLSVNPSPCVLGQPVFPGNLVSCPPLLFPLTRLTLCHSSFPLRYPEIHSDVSLCPDVVAKDGIHLTSHSWKSIDNRFLSFLSIVPLLVSPPSFSFCVLCMFGFPPYEVAVSSTSICIRCCSTCPHP